MIIFFFFQAEDGIRDLVRSRGLGDVYKRQDIHTAVISDNMDAVKQHIAAGSDLNAPDPFGGSSPLILSLIHI